MNPLLEPSRIFSHREVFIQKWTAQLTLWDTRVKRLYARGMLSSSQHLAPQAESMQSKLEKAWILLSHLEQAPEMEWHRIQDEANQVCTDVGSSFKYIMNQAV